MSEGDEKRDCLNLCCLGVEFPTMVSCCVIADMCPTIKVTVVDVNKDIPMNSSVWRRYPTESKMIPIIHRCFGKNLFLAEDMEASVREADMIFVAVNSGVPTKYEASADDIKYAGEIIAANINSDKIIVDRSLTPKKNMRILKEIFAKNKSKENEYKVEVIANPEFHSYGEVIENMLNPTRILIDSENTPGGLAAAGTLVSIYSKWVSPKRIVYGWHSELLRILKNVFKAERISVASSLCLQTKKFGCDLSKIINVINKSPLIGPKYFETTFSFGNGEIVNDVNLLVNMFNRLKLPIIADHWRSILEIDDLHAAKFRQLIFSTFLYTVTYKKMAIWGIASKKNTDVIKGSPAVNLCRALLLENAKLNIYDPKVKKREIVQALIRDHESEGWEKNITVFDDPIKATVMCHAIILCTDWEEIKEIDFSEVYKSMLKSSLIFDGRHCLPHKKLVEMGFNVESIGGF